MRVGGDGRPVRSYLYAADLAVWLWTLIFRGTAGSAYNVGSERAVSIVDLARAAARAAGPEEVGVTVAGPPGDGPAPRYVPATFRARSELGLQESFTLDEALARTIAWSRRAV